jgi:hypothetical protein
MVEINLLPSFSLFSDFVPSRKFAPSFERWHHSCDFTGVEGARGGYLIVNMDDASQLPAMAEPLFLGLGATVQIQPVFTLDDMPRVTEAVEQARQKYA